MRELEKFLEIASRLGSLDFLQARTDELIKQIGEDVAATQSGSPRPSRTRVKYGDARMISDTVP